MDDLVGADIASLSESLSANFTLVWALSSVSAFVSLQVSKLRKRSTTTGLFAWVWLNSGMSSFVNVQVCLLIETLAAVRNRALVTFLRVLRTT